MELILANNEEWLKSQLIGINYTLDNVKPSPLYETIYKWHLKQKQRILNELVKFDDKYKSDLDWINDVLWIKWE